MNVGKRQAGRVHPENIINVDDGNLDKIIKAVNKALSSSFKNSINNISNPYQKNHALDKTYFAYGNFVIVYDQTDFVQAKYTIFC